MSETKDFIITREFNAPRELVWKTWTEKIHIEKWGSPQGFTMTFKKFEFKVGGETHYCQKTSDGSEIWGKQTYIEINPPVKLVYTQSFADENGNIISHPMSQTWPLKMLTTIILEEKNNKTLLTLTWTPYESNDEGIATFNGAMEGMSKGWAGSFAKFEEYLMEIQK
ncbi:MAG TPA: SRPBCC domain-containing protein [Leptospiraceae bacterium]|nr:SRPBCC domain-containing protein [Leptospiraceae bacterium]HRG75238.1 SRPBCC domain-containing protein [Leptospiraceae bacterium]